MTSFSDAAKSPKIEMVFLDVDGTLLDDDHEMAPRTIAAIRDVAATGTQISFASGRPLKSLLHVAEKLPDVRYFLASNGGIVFDRENGLLFRDTTSVLPPEAVDPVLAHVAASSFGYCLYTPDHWIAMGDRKHVNLESEISAIPPDAWLDHGDTSHEALAAGITKIMVIGDKEPINAMFDDIKSIHNLHANVYILMDGVLDVMPLGVDKSAGIDKLLQHLQIDSRNTLAIGDGSNDHEMLAHVGVGVAMGNASALLKAGANHVAPTNVAFGAAITLEAFVLGNAESQTHFLMN